MLAPHRAVPQSAEVDHAENREIRKCQIRALARRFAASYGPDPAIHVLFAWANLDYYDAATRLFLTVVECRRQERLPEDDDLFELLLTMQEQN